MRTASTRVHLSGVSNALVSELGNKPGAQVIPIDGKTDKGSYAREQQKTALDVVSA